MKITSMQPNHLVNFYYLLANCRGIVLVAMFLKSREGHDTSGKALPLNRCYAKTVNDNGVIDFGLEIAAHSIIVGEVARRLILLFPSQVQTTVFIKGSALIAACHDIGKVNPLFMKKLYDAVSGDGSLHIPELAGVNSSLEEVTGYHAGVSQAMFSQSYPTVAKIVGRHHGKNPKGSLLANDAVIGGEAWQMQREALFAFLKQYFDEDIPEIDSIHIASAIAGLVTVSDWIGSGTVFQNLRSIDYGTLPHLVDSAIQQAGFHMPSIRKNLSFDEIFGFPARPTQKTFSEMVTGPGVYVLEALMGAGKTEAALYAAYKLLERGQNSGIYFALPTKLTSESMYQRMNAFLQRILVDPARQGALLLHGTAWLSSSDMGEEGEVGNSWFDPSKRRILAPFGVGTLDQALLSVLHVKHGFVRSFGLAGKIVILDEVHSYDAYTGTLLQNLITQLRDLGCTVILLSATLTHKRKEELIGEPSPTPPIDYPLITSSVGGEITLAGSEPSPGRMCHVACTTDEETVFAQIRQCTLEGMQVLWIENTVGEAQEVFKHFAAWGKEAEVEVGLIHSRFPPDRRQVLEAHWVDLYGKSGSDRRGERGRILVGTQVLEQSLDIDADLLVTRLAPSDMILQRAGRVWRHRQHDEFRPKASRMAIIILVPQIPDDNFNPLYGFGPSGAVYDPYVLWRSYLVWKDIDRFIISRDLRPILERTYEERIEQGRIAIAKQELIKRKDTLQRFAFNGMAMTGVVHDDESVQTRYSDLTTCPVLLLKEDPRPHSPFRRLMDGSTTDVSVTGKDEQRKIAIQILKNLITVTSYVSPDAVSLAELQWLKPFHYIADEPDARIRVAVLDESGTIRKIGGGRANETYQLSYTEALGYVAKREKEEL